MPPRNARALAFAALREWRKGGEFADAILQRLLARAELSAADRAFSTELVYGVLRNLSLLDFWLGELRSDPLDDTARDLLRLGLYQLFRLRTPEHAAVNETVALAAAGRRAVVNAVLRAAIRRRDELGRAAAAQPLPVRASHPSFLVERWSRAFGEAATTELCEWNNTPAPLYARTNGLRLRPDQFLARYPAAQLVAGTENFVRLSALPVEALERGECYMQDPSTAVACELLRPNSGEAVLDACAAPGGKTALLAELMRNDGRLVAIDRDPARVRLLQQNLARLGVTVARVLQHDWTAAARPAELAQATFDRILVDAPCTNTGVMRRRVDVRWRLRADDFARMQRQQLAIVRAVFPLLNRGGALVYSTCSIEPEENEAVVEKILAGFPQLEVQEQRAVLPFRDGFDGAFAARLVRRG